MTCAAVTFDDVSKMATLRTGNVVDLNASLTAASGYLIITGRPRRTDARPAAGRARPTSPRRRAPGRRCAARRDGDRVGVDEEELGVHQRPHGRIRVLVPELVEATDRVAVVTEQDAETVHHEAVTQEVRVASVIGRSDVPIVSTRDGLHDLLQELDGRVGRVQLRCGRRELPVQALDAPEVDRAHATIAQPATRGVIVRRMRSSAAPAASATNSSERSAPTFTSAEFASIRSASSGRPRVLREHLNPPASANSATTTAPMSHPYTYRAENLLPAAARCRTPPSRRRRTS